MYTKYGPLILMYKDLVNFFVKLLNKFIYNPGVLLYGQYFVHR